MKSRILGMLLVTLAHTQAADVTSGRASASWITASETARPGELVHSAVRIRIDPGWHIYWTQPGEGGVKTEISCKPPAGWVVEGPGYPPPKRFLTGELASFGYEGTVLFPLTIRTPAGFGEPASLVARVSWLACSEDACVPGEAELTLTLRPGNASATDQAGAIATALRKIPRPAAEGLSLAVSEDGPLLKFQLTAPAGNGTDFSTFDVFPATPDIIAPTAILRFAREGGAWSASAPKSGYAPSRIDAITLVLASRNDGESWEIPWKNR